MRHCWGDDSAGQATPLAAVDGTDGTATAIAAGYTHTHAIMAPEPSALLASAAGIGSLLALARGRRRVRARRSPVSMRLDPSSTTAGSGSSETRD